MQPIVNMSQEDRATDRANMHKKFGKDRACGSGDSIVHRQTDRQTERHTDRQTDTQTQTDILITILLNHSRG